VSNLYFNYALVLRAVTKLGPSLKDYTFCSGDPIDDRDTKEKVRALTSAAGESPKIFDESLMFVNGEGPSLKEDFRNRFRNVSRLMDCVGCDKCRLWGKVQTAGYGAALKVLFESENNSVDVPKLGRTEIVALFNTLARISSSLEAINRFREMVEAEESVEDSVGHHHVKSAMQESSSTTAGSKNSEATEMLEEKEEPVEESLEDEYAALERDIKYTHVPKDQTFSEALYAEFGLVWRVAVYIVRSWIKLPKLA
jgi:hypothetical protein